MLSQGITFKAPAVAAPQTLAEALPRPSTLSSNEARLHTFHSPRNLAGSAGELRNKRKMCTSASSDRPSAAKRRVVTTEPRPSTQPVVQLQQLPQPRMSLQESMPQVLPVVQLQQQLPQLPQLFTQTSTPQILPPVFPTGIYTNQQRIVVPLEQPNPPQATPYTTQRHRIKKQKKEAEGQVFRAYKPKSQAICKQCNKERIQPGHKQYFGNWFCSATASECYDEWVKKFKDKGYGKKKQ